MRPEFWADRQLAKSTSRDARLLYHGLWNLADEEGRAPGSAEYIKGVIYPYETDIDADDVDAMLAELAAAGKVVRYVVAGDPYLWLPNLGKHNRLNPTVTPSKLPPPPEPDPDEPALFDISVPVRGDSGIGAEPVRNDSAPKGGRGKGLGIRVVGAPNARTEPEPPPPRTCAKHPDGTDDPCRGCQRARERRQAYDAEVKAEQARVAERQRNAPRCPQHPGELADRCRACAAEMKGRG